VVIPIRIVAEEHRLETEVVGILEVEMTDLADIVGLVGIGVVEMGTGLMVSMQLVGKMVVGTLLSIGQMALVSKNRKQQLVGLHMVLEEVRMASRSRKNGESVKF
jgi:hypothetical protein